MEFKWSVNKITVAEDNLIVKVALVGALLTAVELNSGFLGSFTPSK